MTGQTKSQRLVFALPAKGVVERNDALPGIHCAQAAIEAAAKMAEPSPGKGLINNVKGWLRRFVRRADGSAAVEFALIIGPLIMLIFACIELALVVLLSVTLDNATEVASREIRTGITTSANSSVNTFKQKICDNMGWLEAGCSGSLQVDVKTYDSFAQVPTTDLIANGQFDTANFSYNIGGGSKIQLVRAYFQWPLFTPFLSGGLKSLQNGDAAVSAKVVFRNEPF